MDKTDLGVVLSLLGQLYNELQMVKAYNHVLIRELAKQKGVPVDELLKEVESIQAKAILNGEKERNKLIDEAIQRAKDLEL